MDAGSFIKHCRDEFDRLMETSPTITDKIVDEFKKTFSGPENSKQRKIFEQLKKPDICDTIISVNETRHKWYLALENAQEEISEEMMNQKEAIIQEQQKQLEEAALKTREDLEKRALLEKEKLRTTMKKKLDTSKMQEEMESLYQTSLDKIENHIKAYEEMFDRKPFADEIKENIGDELPEEHIERFLQTYNVDTIPDEGDNLV